MFLATALMAAWVLHDAISLVKCCPACASPTSASALALLKRQTRVRHRGSHEDFHHAVRRFLIRETQGEGRKSPEPLWWPEQPKIGADNGDCSTVWPGVVGENEDRCSECNGTGQVEDDDEGPAPIRELDGDDETTTWPADEARARGTE